jgi:hypothetical protein
MFILIITIRFGIAAARIALFCLWPSVGHSFDDRTPWPTTAFRLRGRVPVSEPLAVSLPR